MLISKSRLAIYAKHAKVTHAMNEVTTCHDYKVVNIIHNPHNTHNDVPTSTFELREQDSLISEDVVEI
jgi:hypothetical protein